ncbi:non-ribosomal peptide synthetase [Paludifilum halophilum]|uniref:Carrier domain-containing protein n=1 Tax=Paludifilum halophilum TaxID=1642702 RepID=A0A235BBD7_9BACL|nr:non-ribosomal peptide synthetase [Paludifilum halophilum]OYD09603.1 hypothetical protein CHM34_00920 [Paludifilum halophilum]
METQLQGFHLSPIQKRIWTLTKERNYPFHMKVAVSIEGNLDRKRLQESLNRLVQKHESLRTGYHKVSGMKYPLQIIDEQREILIQERNVDPERSKAEIGRLMSEPGGKQLSAQLIRQTPNHHVLILSMPAICSDLETKNILRELARAYNTSEWENEEEGLQYIAVSEWLNEVLHSVEGEEGREYWDKIDYKPFLEASLPGEKSGGSLFEPSRISFPVGEQTRMRIDEISSSHHLTPWQIVLSAWMVWLRLLTDRKDVLVGTGLTGRTEEELADVIGSLSRYVPIQTRMDSKLSFDEVIEKIGKLTAEAEQLQESFNPEDGEDSRRFPFVFDAQDLTETHSSGEVSFSIRDQAGYLESFKIGLSFVKRQNGYFAEISYDSHVFTKEDIQTWGHQFLTLLDSGLEQPRLPIQQLKLMDEREQQQVLYGFNQTEVRYPRKKCLHQLFTEQAANTPDRLAVEMGSRSMTYKELDQRSNGLAAHLIRLGVQSGSIVGISINRSIEMVIGILGTLKAGAAYLPLDPGFPDSRIQSILKDTGADAVLTGKEWVHRFDGLVKQNVLLEESREWVQSSPPAVKVGLESPAYIIYTSGSTGKPKGVVVEHQSVYNHMNWMNQRFPLTREDRVLQKTSISFDASVWEFFAPLLSGACLVMAQPGIQTDPLSLANTVIRERISVLQVVPSMLRMLLEENRFQECRSLKRVFSGGEVLTAELKERFFHCLPDTDLINLYGPTETCIQVLYFECEKQGHKNVPIGTPVSNMQIFILDENQNPVPIGMTGEIHVSGPGVARGYLNRPDLTQEKFILHPFGSGRMYKTGDLGRWLPDGNVDFVERQDHQLKIRGFRVEPGEIESALTEHDSVRAAVVIGRGKPGQNMTLCAYVIAEGKTDACILKNYLSKWLPDYMIPSHVVFMDQFPVKLSGKVDRKALPEPRVVNVQANEEPATPMEVTVANIWSEVLGVDKVGANHHFFHLGGHSLLAVQVTTQARQHFGVNIPIQWIFDYPVLRDWSKKIEKQQRNGKTVKRPSLQALARRNQNIPLSFSQQGLWFIEQLDPGSPLYNVPRLYRLAGKLNRDVAEKSFFALANRHEILRVTFGEQDGSPAQVVNESSLPTVSFHLATSEEEARKQIDTEARAPFDLENGPLLRVNFFSLDNENHLMLVNMHHLICDLWSMDILIKEWLSFYESYQTGQPPSMESLPVQFTDYARLEKDLLASDEMERQLDFWKNKLSGELPTLTLFPDQSHHVTRSSRGKEERFRIPSDVVEKLQEVGGRRNATLYMTVMAAFQALLHRYSQQNDIVVGTPVAGRMDAETENLIGCFVNTIVIRTDHSGEPTFHTLLDRVKTEFLQAFDHQDVPFEKVVRALCPDRDQSHSPLFQVMLSFQSRPNSAKGIPGLKVKGNEYIHTGTSKFDLTLYIEFEEDGWVGYWEYRTDRFEEDAVKRMSDHFLNLLQAITDDPDQPINQMNMLTDAEKRQLLYNWNDTDVSFPSDTCLHELFEKQAGLTPNAVAAIYKDKEITYGQLEKESNRLAHFLRERGVRKDTCVGVYMERSLELVTALLGILKAGGAFLPLDTEAPNSRIMTILQDAKAPLCLTEEHLAKKLGVDLSVALVSLDSEKDVWKKYPDSRVQSEVSPDDLVSVYYTSGSTGQPKGVASAHRGWVNRMHWMQRQHQLQPGESVLQKTTLTFDDAAVEFFWPLMAGGRIALIEPGMHRDPRAILDAGIRYQVSVIQFVPSMLGMVIDTITEKDKQSLNRLRVVISSGEALHGDLVKRFLQYMPGKLFNTWGATEVSIDSTMHACSEQDVQDAVVSVGRPIDNNQVYVLDRNLQPVPLGVAGDLYIGGIGVARGYLNQPERTKHAFLDHPFRPGLPLYRTGDRGCFRKDGSIIFLGREDNQVKIRGMRVETGEIENTLLEHEAVKKAVVILREDQSVKRLVAYLVSTNGIPLDSGEIRMYLQDKLPEYMIPAYYMVLEHIPVNANGKVDQTALPAPDSSHLALQEDFMEPRTDTEKTLTKIWSELIGLDKIGIQDHFFKLGGHSLLAVQVISRIYEATGVRLPLRSIFEKPNIKNIAARIDQQKGRNHVPKDIEPTGQIANLPLSFAQQRLWFLHQLNPESSVYNMPKCYIIRGTLNLDALKDSLKQLIERHTILRTVFESDGEGYPVQSVLTQSELPLEYKDLSHLPPEEKEESLREIFHREARRPFQMTEGPLFRLQLLRCDEKEHRLIFNMHHMISDGWSIGIMIREISEIYSKICAGTNVNLPPLPVQYGDYALWQKEYLTDEALKNQLIYWKKQLGGEIPSLQLPVDTSSESSELQDQGNSRITYRLSEDLVQRLKEISHKEQATLFMTLLAAFKVLLHRITDQDDILVGTPIVNRDRRELESLIGLFLNTLVLRTDLSGNPSFTEQLQRVRTTSMDAYSHQEVPFERVVEEVQPERSLNRNPLFDVMINYITKEEIDDHLWNIPGADVEEQDFLEFESKFFMTLYIFEREQGLQLDLVYRSDKFSDSRMKEMLNQYQNLLDQIIQDPQQDIHSYTLVTRETEQMLPDPGAPIEEVDLQPVTKMFEDQVTCSPQRVAVIRGEDRWTYIQLKKHSDYLAWKLRKEGVQKGQIVAITGGKSFKLIASILAVWKRGGVFLPIDEKLPLKRKEQLLGEARADMLLDMSEDGIPDHEVPAIRVLRLEEDRSEELYSPDFDGMIDHPQPGDPAYIYFTSGTTGRPKGILGQHKGLSHFLDWQKEEFDIQPYDRFAQLTHISFDAFLRDVFLPLVSGATVCLPEEPVSYEADYILPWIQQENISVLHIVPSLIQSWLTDRVRPTPLPSLRYVFFSGEALTSSLIQRWRSKFLSDIQLINLYGPTETTMVKCFSRVPQKLLAGAQPLQQPMPQTQILILNRNDNLCGIGEVGEVVIRTPYRTKGYINHSRKNENSFVPNPFSSGPEEDLLYRTGDLGRYRPDGSIEILGRRDHQIKIRGVRVDLNEVVSTLHQHPQVAFCTVKLWKKEGESFLAAYVIPAEESFDETALRRYLGNRLPVAMIPSAFLHLEQMPVTSSGKVDYRRLPEPKKRTTTREYKAFSTPEEKMLLEIWSDVLPKEDISVDDNFFEHGGHSLLALQIISRIKNIFGIHLPLKCIFEAPTISELAAMIQKREESSQPSFPESEIKALRREQYQKSVFVKK